LHPMFGMEQSNFVVDLMSRAPVVVGPQTTASAAADHAARHSVHYLLVIDGYRLRGVICACDLQLASPEAPVSACMHAPPITIDDQSSCAECEELMNERAVGCLPVVDWSGALTGVVTRHDLRKAGLWHEQGARCASCDSSHGLNDSDSQVVFCRRCLEQACPATAEDDGYFMLGGGD